MVIADGLQQKEAPPGLMMSSRPVAPLGTVLRAKKTYVTSPLTNEVARSLGHFLYLFICKFNNIKI
jgi:hypothetical protein